MPTEHRVLKWLGLATLLVTGCADDERTPPGPEIDADVVRLDFGDVVCGTSSTQRVTLRNLRDEPMDIAIASTLADVTITPDQAALAAGEAVTVDVVVAMPAIGTPGFAASGDLTVTSSTQTLTVPLAVKTAGILVTFEPTLDFGELLPGDGAHRSTEISASGTGTVTLATGVVSDPAFVVFGGARTTTLIPGLPQSVSVDLNTGTTDQTFNAALPLAFTGPLCNAPADHVALTGAVSANVVTLDHTVIDFGDVTCGHFGEVALALTNHGAAETDFTVVATDASDWLVALASSGFVASGATQTVAVGHAGSETANVPPGAFVGLVDLVLNRGAVTKTIPVRANVLRSILAVSTDVVDFGDVHANTTVTRTFRVTNSGNVSSNASGFTADGVTFSPQSFQIAPGASRTITVTVAGGGSGTFTSSIGFTDDASCQPQLPVTVRGRFVP